MLENVFSALYDINRGSMSWREHQGGAPFRLAFASEQLVRMGEFFVLVEDDMGHPAPLGLGSRTLVHEKNQSEAFFSP